VPAAAPVPRHCVQGARRRIITFLLTPVNASASVSYKLIDPLTKPTLAADFSSAWEATSSTYSTNNFSVSVPAGQVVIFALKTSPHLWGSNGANDYSNYHGFYNFATGAMPNFRPHLATYRRLLQGKWD
jgi:hypothetical protein